MIPNNDKPRFIREAAPTFGTTAVADAVGGGDRPSDDSEVSRWAGAI